MNKLLGIEDISQADQRYLEALTEAYNNADSWDTRRQILSVMTGVAPSTTTTTTTTTTNFIENWKITNYITFPPANSL